MSQNLRSVVLLAAGITVFFPSNGAAAVERWSTAWRSFRSAYPYHIQVVALSKPDQDGRRLLIVSEPPPSITLKDITAVDPANLSDVSVVQHGIGYDGWVEDVLVDLPPLNDPRLATLIDALHERLFGTAYKAVAVQIPDKPPERNTDYQLDLRVPAGKLRDWLAPEVAPGRGWFWPTVFVCLGLWGLKSFGSERTKRHVLALGASVIYLCIHFVAAGGSEPHDKLVRFRPVMGGDLQSCKDLLTARKTGVYESETPGLILWILDKGEGLNRYGREARRFALDSDILLGAVGSGGFVAIVGRERIAPVALLPPLRAETIVQLAAAKEKELSQSYERTHIFAGRFNETDDWAPIYLSDNLIDTEYGSLLNVTDQLLKSWSSAGYVEYINFHYPKPAKYPFPQPLSIYANASEVTFNWNTKGSGYAIQSGDNDVFAWTRTGALPVDYLGGKNARLHDAEDKGYDYFATRNDPNLVRVVQYAQLYQIFRHYDVTANAPPVTAQPVTPAVFVSQAQLVIQRFARTSDARLRAAYPDIADDLVSCRQGFAEVVDKLGDDGVQKLAQALAAPRLYERALRARRVSMEDKNSDEAAIAGMAFRCQDLGQMLQQFSDLDPDELRKAYVQALDRETTTWIHTPSIVISRSEGPIANMVGGHDLGSAITEFRDSTDVAPGKVRVIEEGDKRIVLHNPADSDKVQATVRSVARDENASAADIEAKAEAQLAGASADSRPMPEVLAFDAKHAPSMARGFQTEMAQPAVADSGWWIGDRPITPAQKSVVDVLQSKQVHAIVIERTGDGHYMIFDGPSRRVAQASTQPAASDAVLAYLNPHGKQPPVQLHLRGFEPREASGFTRSTEVQLAGFREPPEVTATVEMSELEPRQLKAFLSEKYNFQEVKIKDISQPFVTAEGEVGVHVDAEIGARAEGRPSLLVRITVLFEKGVQMTMELISAIRTRVQAAFQAGEIGVGSDEKLLLTHSFVKSLKGINTDIKYVEVKVTHEGKDLYIVLNRDYRIGTRGCGPAA